VRILVVHAHPLKESFSAAVLASLLKGLSAAGHEARVIDLYAEGFDPVMRADERARYMERGANTGGIADHLERVRWAEGLIAVYPTWWYGPPAILKGWLERVFVPHETFEIVDAPNPIRGLLTNIRLLGGVSTYGSPWWLVRLVMHDPGRTIVLRGLRQLVARDCRTFWLGLYRMDTASAARRRAFLAKVEAQAARL
jgi:putative NADPH-quinone reductase